ncbi:hypothetical protein F4779DRAFT_643875 [Xylariaceae sp. FL0662B]|nr:hypothetical protein F4779DRAFT_643875 [Xylariaceae sp. FL0662B]
MDTVTVNHYVNLDDTRSHDVIVDLVDVTVIEFRFAPLAYFLQSHSPGRVAQDMQSNRESCLAFCVAITGCPAKQRGTVFLLRPLTEEAGVSPADDLPRFIKIRVTCIGQPALGKVVFHQFIVAIKDANLFTYQLLERRGHRFWILAVISQFQKFTKESNNLSDLRTKPKIIRGIAGFREMGV